MVVERQVKVNRCNQLPPASNLFASDSPLSLAGLLALFRIHTTVTIDNVALPKHHVFQSITIGCWSCSYHWAGRLAFRCRKSSTAFDPRTGYPADEAASLQAFRYTQVLLSATWIQYLFSSRQSQAGDLFLGAYIDSNDARQLVGYVCSTLSPAETLTHESMSAHVPNSSSV